MWMFGFLNVIFWWFEHHEQNWIHLHCIRCETEIGTTRGKWENIIRFVIWVNRPFIVFIFSPLWLLPGFGWFQFNVQCTFSGGRRVTRTTDDGGNLLVFYTQCQWDCKKIKEVTKTQGNQKQGYNNNSGCRGAATKAAEGKWGFRSHVTSHKGAEILLTSSASWLSLKRADNNMVALRWQQRAMNYRSKSFSRRQHSQSLHIFY